MNHLKADALSVVRGGRRILKEVSFAAAPGEFIVVIGPNGAGKSTLLSALAGLITPDEGQVTLDGMRLADMLPKELARRRAYLPQNPRIEWPIALERLVALGLTPHLPALGRLPLPLADAVTHALAAFDLEDRRDQPATTLSGGELARAMLARATVAKPAILIVDEPVTGLDPRHALQSMRYLSAYAASGGSVIASLHDLTLAVRYASRIIALKAGRLAGEGALTTAMIQDIFEVEARLAGAGLSQTVDILDS
jgi:iron complex transport system ATP-binding protein